MGALQAAGCLWWAGTQAVSAGHRDSRIAPRGFEVHGDEPSPPRG